MYAYAIDPDGCDAVAAGFRERARGFGHAGTISVFKNGAALFSHYGPQRPGHVPSFAISNVQFGPDGASTSQSYQKIAAEIAAEAGYSPEMMQFAYFETSASETTSLLTWQKATQKASDSGAVVGYQVLGSGCRDYCLTGLYKGGATGASFGTLEPAPVCSTLASTSSLTA